MNTESDRFIEQAVNVYSDMLYRIAVNITGNRHDAYDVCQEVFLRLIKNRDKIRDEAHLKAWLIRVAVNVSKSLVSSPGRKNSVPLENAENLSSPDSEGELIESVRSLPAKYAAVIYLFYYEDMKISEISRALGISQSAVKLRLSRGREKLRSILEKGE